MKKTRLIGVGMVVCFLLGVDYHPPVAAKADTPVYNNGLGYMINAAKTGQRGNSFITNNLIYIPAIYQNLTATTVNIGESKDVSTSGSDLLEYTENFYSTLEYSSSADIDLGAFAAHESNRFALTYSGSLYNASSQYLYSKNFESIRRMSTLDGVNKETVKGKSIGFTQTFSQKLMHLITPATYEAFFDTYGTHMITKIKLGGAFERHFAIFSNTLAFEKEISTEINRAINLSVESIGNIGTAMQMNSVLSSSYNTAQIRAYDSYHAYGGVTFAYTNAESYVNNFEEWAESLEIAENQVIIGYDDGLIPIYELLPANRVSLRNQMKIELENYLKKKMVESLASKLPNVLDMDCAPIGQTLEGVALVETPDYSWVKDQNIIRADALSTSNPIRDDGIMKNPYDKVSFSQLQINPKYFKELGYTQLSLKIYMEAFELDDGKQYVATYPSLSSTTAFQEKAFNHSSGKKKQDWRYLYIFMDSVNFNQFTNDEFVLRYSASGLQDDDWINRNIIVSYTVSKLALSY